MGKKTYLTKPIEYRLGLSKVEWLRKRKALQVFCMFFTNKSIVILLNVIRIFFEL